MQPSSAKLGRVVTKEAYACFGNTLLVLYCCTSPILHLDPNQNISVAIFVGTVRLSGIVFSWFLHSYVTASSAG